MLKRAKVFVNKKYYRCYPIEDKELIEEKWRKYKNNNALLIDVRSPQEFKEGHIKDAISIPYYEMYKKADKELKDKMQPIILYCNTGNRTKKAAEILKKMGYINIIDEYNIEEEK